MLGLKRPIANSGLCMGRTDDDLPWERLDWSRCIKSCRNKIKRLVAVNYQSFLLRKPAFGWSSYYSIEISMFI